MVNLRGNKTPNKALVETPAKPVAKTPRASKTPKAQQTPLKRDIKDVPQEVTPGKKPKPSPKGKKSMPAVLLKKDEPQSDPESEIEEVSLELSQSSEAVTESPKTKSPKKDKKEKKPKGPKEMQEIPTIMVRNLRSKVLEKDVKAHFEKYGEIVSCKVIVDKKSKNKKKAIIQFKELEHARCAEGTQNGKEFQGWSISVQVLKTAHLFTKENTVALTNIPSGVAQQVYGGVKTAMNKFGKVAFIKFTSNMASGNVQFEDNAGVTAALEAGCFELMDTKVAITAYGEVVFETPETKVILYGLANDTTQQEIEAVVSKHGPIVSIYFPKDKTNKPSKTQVIVGLKTKDDVVKLLAKKTLKVKDTSVHVLPHHLSQTAFNKETHLYYRHPGGVFVENITNAIQPIDLQKEFAKIGAVQKVLKQHHNKFAVVIFEHAEDAQKALKDHSLTVKNVPLKLHAVDGSYIPSNQVKLSVGTTLYFSNIDDQKHIPDLIKKLKVLKLRFARCIPNICPITKHFKNGVFLEFSDEKNAKQIIGLELVVNDKPVIIEIYDPSKHDASISDCMICIENLDVDITEINLWKSCQGFGQIKNTVVNSGTGYVEFASADIAKKALKSSSVDVNGQKFKVIKPTKEIKELLRKKTQTKSKQNKQKGMGKSPKNLKNKATFKPNTFKKRGVKTPRRSL